MNLSYAIETFSQTPLKKTHVLTLFSRNICFSNRSQLSSEDEQTSKRSLLISADPQFTTRHILQKNPGLFHSFLQFCPVRRERHAELRRDFNAVTRLCSFVKLAVRKTWRKLDIVEIWATHSFRPPLRTSPSNYFNKMSIFLNPGLSSRSHTVGGTERCQTL